MQIEHLRCFIALSQTQSITKTSYAFHTTPQNISRILRKLESEMNVPLFERHPNGITLTSFGEHFLKFAKSTLYQFDEMHAAFQFKISENTTNQQITVYSNNAINETILNDILIAFAKDYPTISVNNIIVDWKEGYQKINDNPQALAFLYTINDDDYLKTAQKNLIVTPAFQLHSIAMVNKNHPLANKQTCTKKQLKDYRLLVLTHTSLANTEVCHILQLDPFDPTLSITCSGNVNACYQMVSNGDYVSLGTLETFLRQDEAVRENLAVIPIADEPICTCALIKSQDLPLDSPQQLLYSYIISYLHRNDLVPKDYIKDFSKLL